MGYFEEAIETFPSSIAQALDRAEGISDKQAKCERLCDVANELIMFFAQMLISEYLEMRESTRNEEIENLLGRIETRPHYTLGTHNEIVLGIWREIGKSSILGHEITRPLGDLPELKQFIETWRKIRSIWFEFHESIERFDHRRGIDKFSGFTGRRQEFKLFDYFSELVQLRNSFSHKDAFPVSCNGIQIYVNLTRIHTSFYDVIGDNLQASLIRFCGLFGPVLSRYREAQVLDVRFENRRRLVEIREIFGLAGLTRRSTTSVVSDNEVEKSELWLYDKLDKKLLRKMTLRTDRYPAPWRKPEHSSRLEGYKVLRHLYPEGAREMLRSSEGKGSPMVPIYVFTDTDINVIFKLDKNPWPNDDHVKRLGKARLEQLVSHDPGFVKRNRWKVRLADISVTEGELTLYVSPVLYHYYLATNLAVAHNEKDIDNSHVLLRNRLVPDDSSIKLHPSALCSNHIGISALVVSVDGNIILPISSERVFSSPNELIPSVSGSMEWPLYQDGTPLMETEKMDQFPIHIRDELLREFREELDCEEAASHDAIGYMSDRLSDTYALSNNEDIRAIVPLAICQNYERGGKPEFFFIIFSNHNTDYYAATPRNGLEHQHKLGNVLLSPVSIHGVLRHASIVALAMQQIDELINQPDLNSVLRASLILFNQYVQRLIAKKAGIQRNQEVQQQPNYRVSARSTPS